MSKTLHWSWSGFGPTMVGPKHGHLYGYTVDKYWKFPHCTFSSIAATLVDSEFYEIRYIVDTLLIRKLLTHSLQIHYYNTEAA